MSERRIPRIVAVTAACAALGLTGASAAGAQPAGNANITKTAQQGAGSASIDATAADGGAIDISAKATGGSPDFLGGLLGGLLPGVGKSGPAIASGDGFVSVSEDLEPGTYRATVTIDDATGVEQSGGNALSTATASASLLPTGTVASEQGDPSLGRDSTELGAMSDVVLEFEFEVGTAGSYTLGVDLIASAQANGAGSSAVTTVSSNAVDAEITPVD